MNVCCKAQAGTMQSSDLMVFVEPADTLIIEIESTVLKQFEHLIRQRIEDKLEELGVMQVKVRVSDRGALDYAIDARIEAAIRRAQGEK
ncbi:citrate lyase acyl carrier protein [Desulfuromonas acetoxidans]|uniref:Citrate lyase acyl carrier protein n=1 Tax=Desulfuromonas acetoxidans (strain DSM 684 / 11070) TaxID=281689 RepID=Q1JZB7_DESA6|nr:citrate lyase acyl carrier protein [Desulfuromonas acetoxidans]EAT15650.1 citrate lyase acyl carrier protein [Desulfuromonas acetoxidans DSM 684]MBF0646613.1 citrate lyase acyl carrier protein [Desulfuromonas acetoxidans]NVD25377.1 citrate lyase acyl carrier protein [Desulfuromonas acetoxidans]NVE17429.1 citrate lyase acyl carrier protein [Desulfuromonas acetoxidans]